MSDQSLIESPAARACRPGQVLVSVCVTCRATTPDASPPGAVFAEAVGAAFRARGFDAVVRPVQCLSVCSRAATVAVQAADGYTFLFGDLATAADADALAAFVASYSNADYGFVPWRERPLALRQKIVARLPPAVWSPADGRQPG